MEKETFAERKNRQSKEWRARNAEHADSLWEKANVRRWAEDPEKMHYASVKARAKKRGYACLTLAEFRELVAPMVCEKTGVKLTWNRYAQGFHSPWAPSVDRIDNSKGYERSNVQLVCWIYNQAKGQFTDEDVKKMAVALCQHLPS